MEHRTGLEEAYVIKNNKRLRMGYTTGSCAAAAAKAAAVMLLTGERVEETALMTPKGILLHLLIEEIAMEYAPGEERPHRVRCAVKKDGGDDPDATHGALIFAEVCKRAQGIEIDGGEGVGRVTKPGLAQPVGTAAINPVPRKMIREEVGKVCRACGYGGGLSVTIFVPEGSRIAAKTFNPRLGIEGGISILGTSGIVVPMSEEALLASIRLEMRMLAAAGAKYLLITPGNYGEAFAGQMPVLAGNAEMKCSNFVGETIDMAREMGIKGILFVAHIGKFIKVSGGIMNTHSRNADSRSELMAAAFLRAGGGADTARRILETVTTEEALDVILAEEKEQEAFRESGREPLRGQRLEEIGEEPRSLAGNEIGEEVQSRSGNETVGEIQSRGGNETGGEVQSQSGNETREEPQNRKEYEVRGESGRQNGGIFARTMEEICRRVEFYLNNRCRGALEIGAVLFSQTHGKLGQTEKAERLIQMLNAQTLTPGSADGRAGDETERPAEVREEGPAGGKDPSEKAARGQKGKEPKAGEPLSPEG